MTEKDLTTIKTANKNTTQKDSGNLGLRVEKFLPSIGYFILLDHLFVKRDKNHWVG